MIESIADMNDTPDWELLQDYAVRRLEAAFRVLTDRHLNLVYFTALRQVNDPPLAEEICQTVFILLARKAGNLKRGVVLAGWLFRTTLFVAARARRAEERRRRREHEAFEMQQLTTPDPAWPRLAPMLVEALAKLPETDRNALLLRFFEDKSHKETGAALGLNEEAARKRVDRALEKLRGVFAGLGFKVSAAVLVSTLTAHAVKAAPAGLAGSVAAAACAGGTAVPAALPSLARQVLSAEHWNGVNLLGSWAAAAAAVVWVVMFLAPKSASPVLPAGGIERPPGTTASVKGTAPIPRTSEAARRPQAGRGVLRLHVVAKDTGERITAAQLAVFTVTQGEFLRRHDLATDPTGTAEVPYPLGTGRLDVGVLAWGWGARFATWTPGNEDFVPADYTLRVERVTNTLGGWLRDAGDHPIANAEISASFDDTGDASARETPRERFGFMDETIIARSDARGRWSCALIPPRNHGGFTLRAKHSDFRPTQIVYGTPTTALNGSEDKALQPLWAGTWVTRMEAGLTLAGRVLDETGRPVAQAVIAHEPFAIDPPVISTSANGDFALRNLDAGDFEFTVSAPGFAPEYRKVNVQDRMEPMEVRLKPGALLRLRLVDEDGEAVAGARVGMEQWGEHRHALKWTGESGAEGCLEWASAPRDEELELCAVKDGWCYTRELRFKADGEEHLITMRQALEISGRVTDFETDQPIADFKAFPGYGNSEEDVGWERLDTRQGTNGNFKVRFQERKPLWRVRVEADGYAPFVSDPLWPKVTGPLEVALQRLDPGRSVRGTVWRPDRHPAAGAEVALITLEHHAVLEAARLRHDPGDPFTLTTDARGRFSFSPDAKAHTVVAVSSDGFARVRVRDPRQPLAIVLQPWGRIEGRIDPSVRMLAIESVVLNGLDPEPNGDLQLRFAGVRPDASGRFVFDLVPPETLCLQIDPGAVGKSYHHPTPVWVAPGQTTTVVITNNGWPVKGRFTLADDPDGEGLKQVTAYLNNVPWSVTPPKGLTGDAAKLWLVDFRKSPAGRQRALENFGANIKPAVDGTFATENSLPPGQYRLLVVVSGVIRLDRQITLSAPEEGAPALYDLGVITIPPAAIEVDQ